MREQDTLRDALLDKLKIAALMTASLLPAGFREEAGAAEPLRNGAAAGRLDPERAAEPVVVNGVKDVIERWSADRNLYVAGDVGLSRQQLDSLASWLRDHPNWTVYLAERCKGERYVDADGNVYQHNEAVEHALGKELPNRTAFGQLVEPRTGEKNGAVLFITFDEDRTYRKVAYLGSNVYDNRGLGEDSWPGNLDRLAIGPLQNGRRVADAVMDPIAHIDRELDRRIRADIERELERKRVSEEAVAGASAARAGFEQRIDRFRAAHPALTGDLVRPDLAGMDRAIGSSKDLLERKQYEEAASLANGVTEKVSAHTKLLEAYEPDAGRIDSAGALHVELSSLRRADVARDELDRANGLLESAKDDYAIGASRYAASLDAAERELNGAKEAIESADRFATRTRYGMALLGLAAIAGLGAAGFVANRRRQGVKSEAEQLLSDWQTALDEKLDKLFALDEMKNLVVGKSKDKISFSGQSLETAKSILSDVGGLFIMLSSARGVVKQAASLIKPEDTMKKLQNFFSRGNYEAAIQLLKDEPIKFDPGSTLELVISGQKSDIRMLAGELKEYTPFVLTYSDLIREFNSRSERAKKNLDDLEHCQLNSSRLVQETREKLNGIRASREALRDPLGRDALFELPSLEPRTLETAGSTLEEAKALSVGDPQSAVRVASETARALEDAGMLVSRLVEARKTELPQIRANEESLTKGGVSPAWIGRALGDLSRRADDLAGSALSAEIRPEVIDLAEDISALGAKTARAVELDALRRGKASEAIEKTEALIRDTSESLAREMKLPIERIMQEEGDNPTVHVRSAARELVECHGSLEAGDLTGASDALDRARNLVVEAEAVVEETRKAFAEYPGISSDLSAEHERLESLLPKHDEILAEIQSRYSPSVMTLGEGDETHPRANGTIADNMAEARAHLGQASAILAQSSSTFADGRILEAAALDRQAAALEELARDRLEEIVEKRDRLERTMEACGQSLRSLEQVRVGLTHSIEDSRTMGPTIEAFETACVELKAAGEAHAGALPNPFEIERKLQAIEKKLEEVADRAKRDREIFDEARRSLDDANNQLVRSHEILREASSDDLTDSAAILRSREIVSGLSAEAQEAQLEIAKSHADWNELDKRADRIAADAARQAALVKKELETAEQALLLIGAAAEAVRLANGWRGGHGVSIQGSPGAGSLHDARSFIGGGNYAEALRNAEASRVEAEKAVREAKALVRAREEAERERQRQEAERRERERRRRQQEEEARAARARSASRSSGSSGFGSSNWGSRSSGGGSGFKSSSW